MAEIQDKSQIPETPSQWQSGTVKGVVPGSGQSVSSLSGPNLPEVQKQLDEIKRLSENALSELQGSQPKQLSDISAKVIKLNELVTPENLKKMRPQDRKALLTAVKTALDAFEKFKAKFISDAGTTAIRQLSTMKSQLEGITIGTERKKPQQSLPVTSGGRRRCCVNP